ncbi:MAG: hypothetical protein D6719_09700 [Candidatus Dadabacteria bacterium]|nr:MAG: hypothetical protein D6719_09700 [Candidatus Dadabacteria bacterium]
MTGKDKLNSARIFSFWLPLASTWLMMAIEGPIMAAVIARMAEPKINLAAYGVSFSLALIAEAPVMMLMTTATALVNGWRSYNKLLNFSAILGLLMSALMLLMVTDIPYRILSSNILNLPENVAAITQTAITIMLIWPAAIAYRRFYQGVLIRYRQTNRVAAGTILRILSSSSVVLLLYKFSVCSGAIAGAAALSAGVLVEAISVRVMASGIVTRLKNNTPEDPPLDYMEIVRFYLPLGITTFVALSIHPVVTFFMGKARMPLESLAVLPVLNSFTFLFKAMALSYQEVIVALIGKDSRGYRPLLVFSWQLGLVMSLIYVLVITTPLYSFWFQGVAGLTPELASFVFMPALLLLPVPACAVWLIWERGMLLKAKRTRFITHSSIIELSVVVLTLFILIKYANCIGAVAAAAALMIGRIAANIYLIIPSLKARHFILKQTGPPGEVKNSA